jgi:cephalosporin-C deacetylase-like acetyl esterase
MSRPFADILIRPPRTAMVPDFVDRRAGVLEAIHEGRPPAESVGRRAVLRADLVDCLGLERLPPTSPSACLVGELERDGYSIQKLVLDALPGLPIPALFYRPATAGPAPAVVHQPGHWMENGKLEPDLQRTNARLARAGVGVLSYDTLGQGERRIGWHQHGQLGTLLVGFTTLAVMVAELQAALDVLAAQAGVDAERLGLVGASGGAWVGLMAAALDPRVQAAAIVCIVNTHRGQIRAARGTGWDGAVDLCNQLPGLCALGAISEIMALAAPRALLQVNAIDDPPFPIGGARRVAAELRELYAAAGAPDAFDYVEVSGGHGLRPEARAFTVEWLCRRLAAAPPPPEQEEESLLDAPYPTTYADVADDPTARQDFGRPEARVEGECLAENVDSNLPVLELARARAAQLRSSRPPAAREDLVRALGPFPEAAPIATVVENRVQVESGYAERISFASEDGVRLDAVLLLPEGWEDAAPPVVVLLDEGGKASALDSPEAAAARARGCAVFAPDLRGTGESACAEWETATSAFMLDRDLLNQRVWDTRRSVETIWRRAVVGRQVDRGRIVLWGRGPFGLVALAAAAADERVAAVGTSGFVRSLEELLTPLPESTPMLYRYRMLEALDVGDLEGLVRPRPVGRDDLDSLLEELG